MANKKQTSTGVATLAARTLADPHKSKVSKKLAGSALAQTKSKRGK